MKRGQVMRGVRSTTASLVLLASRFGLPVSTTHVSVGALIGIGTLSGSARWKTIKAASPFPSRSTAISTILRSRSPVTPRCRRALLSRKLSA